MFHNTLAYIVDHSIDTDLSRNIRIFSVSDVCVEIHHIQCLAASRIGLRPRTNLALFLSESVDSSDVLTNGCLFPHCELGRLSKLLLNLDD
jgi:hypothetical protein